MKVDGSVRKALGKALEREDVQVFLSRREVAGSCYCGKPVKLEDDGQAIHILKWAVVDGEKNLGRYETHPHHIDVRRPSLEDPAGCEGDLSFREWINPKSSVYSQGMTELAKIIRGGGLVQGENGRWTLKG